MAAPLPLRPFTLPAGELLTLARELRKIHTIPCGGKGLMLQVGCCSVCV